MTIVLLAMMTGSMTARAGEVTYSPVLDVNFRTAAGNTSWQTVKNAADEGNNDFELTYAAGFFSLQKYTVPDLAKATKLVLTLTVGSKSGVDALDIWSIGNTSWDASTGVDDIVPAVTALVGVAPRATEGTANTPNLVKGNNNVKVANSNPAKAAFTISGTALQTLKNNASADGTFTLLITNNAYTNSNSKRSYLSNNTANDEANRPTLVATIETPAVINKTTGASFSTLAAAWAALTDADTELEIYEDQTLTGRLTWSKAKTLTLTPKKDITIKGHTNQMWFLVNTNNGTLNIGGEDYTITLDGQNKQFGAYGVTCYENSSVIALKNVVFKDFDLNNAGWLVNSKAAEGQIIIDRVTFSNCKNPASAFINKLRVTNDRVVLKGFLNQESCTGTTIYAASETKSSGTTGRIKIDDNDFTANSDITIEWPGTKEEGIVVVIGTKGQNASKFKLTDTDWTLERKASNGDLIMKKAGWLDFVQGDFTHPGLLHTAADIARVKANLTVEPFKSAYAKLETVSGGSAAAAVEYLKRLDQANWGSTYSDYSNYTHAATDAKLAYELALRYQLKGSTAAATAAVSIVNDWATKCKGVLRLDGYTNNIPDPNEYLICIQAYQFANAAELLRDYSGWTADDFTAFKSWMRETFGKLAYEFLETHHGNSNALHYWLNWDLAALTAMYSVGVLCDDQALVDYALDYVDNGTGTGNKANAIIATFDDPDSDELLAQCQESGRDQGHATLDVTLLGTFCQMAQSQGTDLFSSYQALEMAEYVAKYNLKNDRGAFAYTEADLPFTTYNYNEGEHTAISSDARGTVRPSYELFLAYAVNNGKSATYVRQMSEWARRQNAYGEANSTSTDELGFGTLMYMSADVADYGYVLNVTSAGAATMVLPFDATIPSDVKVYTLSYTAGSDAAEATEVTAIEANVPVLVVAEEGSYTFSAKTIWQQGTTATKGALTGVFSKTVVPAGSFILTLQDDKLGFRKVDGSTNTVEANRAYLTAEGAGSRIAINFGDETTGISQIENGKLNIENEVYDLQGRRMADGQTKHGIYVVSRTNGKKIVIK